MQGSYFERSNALARKPLSIIYLCPWHPLAVDAAYIHEDCLTATDRSSIRVLTWEEYEILGLQVLPSGAVSPVTRDVEVFGCSRPVEEGA